MKTITENTQFNKLCELLNLGAMTGSPKSVAGGLLHKMYLVETTKGCYAVKALNPAIMQRPTALLRYIQSERIAEMAAREIPALPARKFEGYSIHKLENQYYMVFDWIEGSALKLGEANVSHCTQIGTILGKLHKLDFTNLDIPRKELEDQCAAEWDFYLQKGQESHCPWISLLQNNLMELHQWSLRADRAAAQLSKESIISHRDLDPKNVLWTQGVPLIIDWEAAGYINPMKEFIETAVSWAVDESGKIEKERFFAFAESYAASYGPLYADWEEVLFGRLQGKLQWLEYSLKRSLLLECADEEEQSLGTAQVIATIKEIVQYVEMIPAIQGWITEVLDG